MSTNFDVVVIGAGPAGYVAAIRCAQLGLKTACIDKWVDESGQHKLGGSCVNAGCIPSKALLDSSDFYARIQSESVKHGIQVSDLSLDLTRMHARKKQVVEEVAAGIEALFSHNQVTWVKGTGYLKPQNDVDVLDVNGDCVQTIHGEHVILATGSIPSELETAPVDDAAIVNSTGGMNFDTVPAKLGIIGSGVVGLELGSIWKRLGSEVVILEAQDRFLSFADQDLADAAYSTFEEQGLQILLNARVVATEVADGQVNIDYKVNEEAYSLSVDKLIVAVGRRPFTDNLCAPELGLVLDEGGFIHVNEELKTSLPNVYAIGDVIRGPMLAHRGMQEAMSVVSIIAGHSSSADYKAIPAVIYTTPEIAWVGKTEQELIQEGESYRIGVFPFSSSGRAHALDHEKGFVKVLAQKDSDKILGVHMIGDQTTELIAQAVIAMEFEASSEDIALTVFAHPSLAEAFKESAMAVNGKAIHLVNE